MFIINGRPITFNCKMQAPVSLLSCEAEYIAFTEAVKVVLFIYRVFDDIYVLIFCTIVNCDKIPAVNLVKYPTNHRNSKHIDIWYHIIRAHVGLTFDLCRVDSSTNLPDMLTKLLAAPSFQRLIEFIGNFVLFFLFIFGSDCSWSIYICTYFWSSYVTFPYVSLY